MNAYIASFMLLVFNAVGLAMPVTEAVAKEQVATNAKLPDAQNSTALQADIPVNDQGEACVSIQSGRLNDIYNPSCSSDGLPLLSDAANSGSEVGAAIAAVPSVKLELADNVHIEGAP